MLTQSEFAAAVRSFVDDLSIRCIGRDDSDLSKVPGFLDEIAERLDDFRDPDARPSVLLSASYGLVGDLISREWNSLIGSAYRGYVADVHHGE